MTFKKQSELEDREQLKNGRAEAINVVLSTDEVDRHGDIISAEGWRLDAYLENPVVLWAHDHRRPPIGRAVQVWLEPHRLLAHLEFAGTAFAQEVAALYRQGYQRGISVGFKPLRYEERRDEKTGAFLGIRFLEQELLEVSAVAVPANRAALRRRSELPLPLRNCPMEDLTRLLAELRKYAGLDTLTNPNNPRRKGTMEIATQDLELIKKGMAAIRDFYQQRLDAELPPLKEEVDRVASQLARVQERQKEGRRSILEGYHTGEPHRVPFGKYRGLDPLDLACIGSVLAAQMREPAGLSPRMLEDWQLNLKAAMDSSTAGTGDELVPTGEAAALWLDVNLETMVAPLFSRVDMPTNPFEIPLQLGEVNWYPGTENLAATSTALKTARQTLTTYELVAEVPWSLTLDEDAVIAMAAEVRGSLVRNAVEVIDNVLLNGNTTLTNNINADGATISSADAGKAQWLVGFDSLLHLPLVDNTSQANNHNAAVSDDMYNELRAKLGKYGVRPSELAYIMDVNTYIRSLGVSNFRTLDKLGPNATLLRGQLGAVEGIPVIVSEQMALADADGKVTDGGNTADTGRSLAVNRSQWRVGYRRERRGVDLEAALPWAATVAQATAMRPRSISRGDLPFSIRAPHSGLYPNKIPPPPGRHDIGPRCRVAMRTTACSAQIMQCDCIHILSNKLLCPGTPRYVAVIGKDDVTEGVIQIVLSPGDPAAAGGHGVRSDR